LAEIKLTITAKDIAEGDFSSGNCPIARAMMRELHSDWVSVGLGYAHVWMGKSYTLCKNGQEFIKKLISGHSLEPCEIELFEGTI